MGTDRVHHIEKAIERERMADRATYFGESIELIADLQLRQCKQSHPLAKSNASALI